MSSKPLNVVAILYPKKGKTEYVLDLLNDVATYIRTNEPGTLKYEIHATLRPGKDGNEEIVMLEQYKDTAALKAHGSSEKFQALQKKMADEGLMRAPMMLKMVAEKGGFKERL